MNLIFTPKKSTNFQIKNPQCFCVTSRLYWLPEVGCDPGLLGVHLVARQALQLTNRLQPNPSPNKKRFSCSSKKLASCSSYFFPISFPWLFLVYEIHLSTNFEELLHETSISSINEQLFLLQLFSVCTKDNRFMVVFAPLPQFSIHRQQSVHYRLWRVSFDWLSISWASRLARVLRSWLRRSTSASRLNRNSKDIK